MKLCLVANEILGAHKNGGIGTATSNLAILLARHGHSVTIFYVGEPPLDKADRWALFYRLAGVEILHFPGTEVRISPVWMKQTLEVFEQLRDKDFELILFQEWLALGHACTVAKRCGLAFQDTALATITHSNSKWIREANRTFPSKPEELAIDFMEQRTSELSDVLVSPSAYLMDWMRNAGWVLPHDNRVIPHFLNGAELLGSLPRSVHAGRRQLHKADHLAFFGRLEERKGISIFLSAIASDLLKPHRFRITFLGRPATKSAEDIKEFIRKYRPDLLKDISIEINLSSDEAQDYLTKHNCLAVMPSLIDNSPCVIYEALHLGLPFVAAASGGIPELVHPDDRERCLFAPTAGALAAKLAEVLDTETWPAPRPAFDRSEIGKRWLAWVEGLQRRQPAGRATPAKAQPHPDVTVVVTHHERPRLLDQNLKALSLQSDQAFKVVVVDDGSRSAEAVDLLAKLEARYGNLALKVVRQENRYLGAARNNGIRNTMTPYVIFLDDDNIAFPNMIEVFREAMRSSGADVVTCQMQFFHEALSEPSFDELIKGERWAFPGGPPALGLLSNCFGDATAIYKREIFDRVGFFHELHGVTHEDWELHLRIAVAGGVVHSLPLPLFWYRVTPDSMIRATDRYANMRVIASAVERHLPPAFAPLAGLLIGSQMAP